MVVITEHFCIAVTDFDAKKSARYSSVLVATELVVSGTQCNGLYTLHGTRTETGNGIGTIENNGSMYLSRSHEV